MCVTQLNVIFWTYVSVHSGFCERGSTRLDIESTSSTFLIHVKSLKHIIRMMAGLRQGNHGTHFRAQHQKSHQGIPRLTMSGEMCCSSIRRNAHLCMLRNRSRSRPALFPVSTLNAAWNGGSRQNPDADFPITGAEWLLWVKFVAQMSHQFNSKLFFLQWGRETQ